MVEAGPRCDSSTKWPQQNGAGSLDTGAQDEANLSLTESGLDYFLVTSVPACPTESQTLWPGSGSPGSSLPHPKGKDRAVPKGRAWSSPWGLQTTPWAPPQVSAMKCP